MSNIEKSVRCEVETYVDVQIDIDDVFDFINDATQDEIEDILEECEANLKIVNEEPDKKETLFDIIKEETLQDVGKLYSFEELCQLVYAKKSNNNR